MTEEIDVKKLTNDAFMAIDALFTDEDDIFSEEEEKKPDDFELIQEYMLAIEWECSEKNIKKFSDFLNKIVPKYTDKHNQDLLKMLTSIVRYLDKSKDKALPETHNVMEFIVKTFKTINQHGVDDATIKSKKGTAYAKVLDLKDKIAKGKTVAPQETEIKYQDTIAATPSVTEPVESSQMIMTILARLELCENRLAAMDAQNIALQQKIYELTNLNHTMHEQINELEVKLSDHVDKLSQFSNSLSTNSNTNSNIDQAMASLSQDDEASQYDEISFDGLDFEEMTSDTEQSQKSSDLEMNLKEVPLDELVFDEAQLDGTVPSEGKLSNEIQPDQSPRFEMDFEQIDADSINFEEKIDSSISFEEITIDDIEYDEISPDDLQYDDPVISDTDHQEADALASGLAEDETKNDDSANKAIGSADHAKASDDDSASSLQINEFAHKHVRCFKIENQIIALPDDKIFNIYNIPSKLSRNIHQMQSLVLGEFSSFFQNLSKNMKGHLSGVSNATLKQMNVDVHLLTNQEVQYKVAVLCSFDDKVSIVPVTDLCDNRSHPFTGLKEEQNSFSDYNIQIFDMGTIPFVALSKK
ncbi:MAG: hypothetical protein HQK62_04975 [Desulfamplus sp.]|nr:hypothetical protein [Desulfamplus sp.]